MAERPGGPPNPWSASARGRSLPPGSGPDGSMKGGRPQMPLARQPLAGRSMPMGGQTDGGGGGRARPMFPSGEGPAPRQMLPGVGSGVPLRPLQVAAVAGGGGGGGGGGAAAGRASTSVPPHMYGRGEGMPAQGLDVQMAGLSLSAEQRRQDLARGDEGSSPSVSGASKITPSSAVSEASSAGAVGLGRGATRGKTGPRSFSSILITKPPNALSKKGEGGEPVRLLTNHFKLLRKPDWELVQYRVDFDPDLDVDRTVVRKALVREHKAKLGEYLFDGTILLSVHNLCPNEAPMELVSKRKEDDSVVRITVRRVGVVSPMDFSYLQVLNLINRVSMESLGLTQIGRDFYDMKGSTILQDFRLEIIPGIKTSIRQYEHDILMCCEISNKILRTDTFLDQLKMCHKQGANQAAINNLLLGCVVITRYNNATYKVHELDWDKNPKSTFKYKDGTDISYAEYYKKRYGLTIRDMGQPMVVSMPDMAARRRGNTDPIFLVPELCHMTGLSDEQRANFRLMKAVGDFTRLPPKERIRGLMKYVERLSSGPVAELTKKWNVKFSNTLETLQGRVREPEMIFQKDGKGQKYSKENADWGFMLKNFRLFNPGSGCAKWILIPCNHDERAGTSFSDCVIKAAAGMGFALAAPKVLRCEGVSVSHYIRTCKEAASMGGCQMIMVIVPNNKGDIYKAIKSVLCVESPVPSQVITLSLLQKGKSLLSVASKVVIQMAAKLGAEPWSVKIPCPDTMIVGYDSYHDSKHQGYSVGAVVSTLNNSCTRYFSTCNLHKNGEEMLAYMKTAVGTAVKKYAEFNGGKLPKRVIVYRDGVGDGQIGYVKEHEVEAIKEVFRKGGFDPMFGYIIVSKRINARFFTASEDNPFSGTIVDDVVTLPERQDFYLISQSVRQGTVNPTSYNVLEDTTGLQPGHLQILSYKMTHLYYNWSGTVRVPAVCQYAHKLAFLVGTSVHAIPAVSLGSTLFYL